MSLGKVPMKADGGAKQNASIKQGTQVCTATQRATNTQGLHPSKVLGRGEGPANKGWRGTCTRSPKKLTKHLPLAPKRPNDNTYTNKAKA